nr:ribonuclease H-like domain-containing protein [Tanacetum cinerariifolium]
FNRNTDYIVGNISLGWIVDSRANQHMTPSAKFLVNLIDISNLGLTVGHPNGTQALITKIGDLKLNDNITLYDVLVVPEYTVSLVDDNYLAIRSNILTREHPPLVKADFAIVSGEEGFNSGSNSNNRGPNHNLECTNYNKIGHTVDRCFEIIGYPVGYVNKNFNSNSKSVGTSNNSAVDPNSNIAGNNTASNFPVSFSNEQLTRLMNLLNDNGISSANAKMSG